MSTTEQHTRLLELKKYCPLPKIATMHFRDENQLNGTKRTILCKPKGLKVKLKVCTVNKNLEVFDEKQNPAASIVGCGLFLASPTGYRVKDPLVLGILNQEDLRDEEPPTEYGVFWASHKIPAALENPEVPVDEMMECCLGKRKPLTQQSAVVDHEYFWMKQNVALIKNGMIKSLPHSAIFDCIVGTYLNQSVKDYHFRNFCSQSTPDLYTSVVDLKSDSDVEKLETSWVPLKPEAKNPTQIFLSFMQNLLKTYKSMSISPPTNSKIEGEGENMVPPDENNKENIPPRFHLSLLASIGRVLVGKHATLGYFKGFLQPKSADDAAEYQALVKHAQNSLNDLASAVLKVLIEPFCSTLGRISLLESIFPRKALPRSCEALQKAKATLERLIKLSTTPLSEIPEHELTEKLANYAGLSEILLLRPISKCLELPHFARAFFRQVDHRLKEYPETHKTLENVGDHLVTRSTLPKGTLRLFKGAYITENFARIGDQFLLGIHGNKDCVVRSAKSGPCVRFSCGFKTHRSYKIQAIVCKGETKVCIIKEVIPEKEKPKRLQDSDVVRDHVTRIRVFTQDQLAASFDLGSESAMGKDRCASRTIQHFTGRYFVKCECGDESDLDELAVLDLAPCFQSPVSAPKIRSIQLNSIIKDDGPAPFVYACTDQFLSYLAVNEAEAGEPGEPSGKPVALGVIRYDSEQGLVAGNSIPCGELFDQITHVMNPTVVFTESDSSSQICWTKEARILFYTHSLFDEDSTIDKTLFIACFSVSPALDSMKTITFSCFQLNHLMRDAFFMKRRPKFRTLITRTKEYLVMDLMKSFEWSMDIAKQPATNFGRALFAVHGNKLHWVPVNGELIFKLPEQIGQEVGCAGYDTSSLPLFHSRRVFSASRVVYTLSRLDYKPL